MASQALNVRVRRLSRQPLRIGRTNITNQDDGSVVNLSSFRVQEDLRRFQNRYIVLGFEDSGLRGGDLNMDSNDATADLAPGTGVAVFTTLELGRGEVLNGLTYYVGATAAVTPTLQKAGLYTSDGTTLTKVATSADLTNTAEAAKAVVPFVFSSPYTTPKPDTYFAAVLFVAGTAPSLVGRKPLNEVVANIEAAKQFSTIGSLADLPATQAISGLTASNLVPLIRLT